MDRDLVHPLGLQAGIQGWFTAGLDAAIDKTFLPLLDINVQFKSASAGFKIANQLANSTLRSAVSGVFAERNGGSFSKSFYSSMFWEGIGAINSEMIINYTAYEQRSMYSEAKPTFKRGNGTYQVFDPNDKERLSISPRTSNAGKDLLRGNTNLGGWFSLTNGSDLMNALNLIPGVNNHANIHDVFIPMLTKKFTFLRDNGTLMDIINISTQIMIIPNTAVLLNQTGMLNMMQNPIK